jgi:hypothetical protein
MLINNNEKKHTNPLEVLTNDAGFLANADDYCSVCGKSLDGSDARKCPYNTIGHVQCNAILCPERNCIDRHQDAYKSEVRVEQKEHLHRENVFGCAVR